MGMETRTAGDLKPGQWATTDRHGRDLWARVLTVVRAECPHTDEPMVTVTWDRDRQPVEMLMAATTVLVAT